MFPWRKTVELLLEPFLRRFAGVDRAPAHRCTTLAAVGKLNQPVTATSSASVAPPLRRSRSVTRLVLLTGLVGSCAFFMGRLRFGGRHERRFHHRYDADWFRHALTTRGITPCIPSKTNRKIAIPHDRALYRQRHRVENMFGKIKDWRRVHTRYDRCAHTFMSAICIAATVIFWL